MNSQIIQSYCPSQTQINRENILKSLRPYLFPYLLKFCIAFLIVFTCSAQYIENSFPAPSDHITGLVAYYNLHAVDSLQKVIYEIDLWSGEVLDTIPIPWVSCSPVGLAIRPDSIMFAESGSALIHVMTMDGDSVGSIDLSVHGLQTITGLSYHISGDLYIADASSNTIYVYELPLGSGNISEYFTLQSCPEIHDIGAGIYWVEVAVACEDTVSPVRIYNSSSSYTSLDFGDYSSAVGVGTASEGNRFYFSDPDMGMIHRYCMDMGGISGHGESNPEIKCSIPNPVEGDTEMQLHMRSSGEVNVVVSDISGREVMFVYEGGLAEGTHSIPVCLKDLPSGVYLLNVQCDDSFSVTEFTLLNSSR